mgnify:FL=1|tara:strand:- start:2514 stop:2699 length:186 start_codon:yes stop_codon:yes gene_type:complete
MKMDHNLLNDVIRSIKANPSDDNMQAQVDRLDREHKLHLATLLRIVERGDGLHPNLENVKV